MRGGLKPVDDYLSADYDRNPGGYLLQPAAVEVVYRAIFGIILIGTLD